MTLQQLCQHADRRAAGTIRNESRALWNERLVVGTPKAGYKLTSIGFRQAEEAIAKAAKRSQSEASQ